MSFDEEFIRIMSQSIALTEKDMRTERILPLVEKNVYLNNLCELVTFINSNQSDVASAKRLAPLRACYDDVSPHLKIIPSAKNRFKDNDKNDLDGLSKKTIPGAF
jgi:hypothetical protein